MACCIVISNWAAGIFLYRVVSMEVYICSSFSSLLPKLPVALVFIFCCFFFPSIALLKVAHHHMKLRVNEDQRLKNKRKTRHSSDVNIVL